MDSACAIEEDANVRASCQNEALRKRQFAIDMCFDVGEGDQRGGHTSLACKGAFNGRRKNTEKLA